MLSVMFVKPQKNVKLTARLDVVFLMNTYD